MDANLVVLENIMLVSTLSFACVIVQVKNEVNSERRTEKYLYLRCLFSTLKCFYFMYIGHYLLFCVC